jgi:hypothetical protein
LRNVTMTNRAGSASINGSTGRLRDIEQPASSHA